MATKRIIIDRYGIPIGTTTMNVDSTPFPLNDGEEYIVDPPKGKDNAKGYRYLLDKGKWIKDGSVLLRDATKNAYKSDKLLHEEDIQSRDKSSTDIYALKVMEAVLWLYSNGHTPTPLLDAEHGTMSKSDKRKLCETVVNKYKKLAENLGKLEASRRKMKRVCRGYADE